MDGKDFRGLSKVANAAEWLQNGDYLPSTLCKLQAVIPDVLGSSPASATNIITRIKRNGYVSLDTIESICHTLNCGVDDILEFVAENNKDE